MESENFDERYRPASLTEIVGQPHVVKSLQNMKKRINIPNMIFCGPPGTGKTSAVIALGKDIYGDDWIPNCRLLSTPNEDAADFIKTVVRRLWSIVPVHAQFRMTVLDDCDLLNSGGQREMLQILETHTATHKTILICNSTDKLIQPLLDRCQILRFRPIRPDIMLARLQTICIDADIQYEPGCLDLITASSGGSLRSAVKSLERFLDATNCISLDDVRADTEIVDPFSIKQMLTKALAGDIIAAETELESLFYDKGLSINKLLIESIDTIRGLSIDQRLKTHVVHLIGLYSSRIIPGADAYLQMRCFLDEIGNRNFH
jgi:replication factor C small subunit